MNLNNTDLEGKNKTEKGSEMEDQAPLVDAGVCGYPPALWGYLQLPLSRGHRALRYCPF